MSLSSRVSEPANHTWKLHCEGESVVETAIPPFGLVLEVGNIAAYSSPTYPCDLHIFARIHSDLHPFIVDGVRLNKVNDVELVLPESGGVVNSEVEPLRDVACVVVRLQNQVVLVLVSKPHFHLRLDCSP